MLPYIVLSAFKILCKVIQRGCSCCEHSVLIYLLALIVSGLIQVKQQLQFVTQGHGTVLFSKGMRITQPEAARKILLSPFGQGGKSDIVAADG